MEIEVFINGEKENISQGTTVAQILEVKKIRPEIVAVEINGELVEKGKYSSLALNPGDQMEFLYYMAGGEIKITQSQLNQIIDHAQKEYPREACGMMAGKEGKVKMVFSATNTDRSEVTYFIDPKEQFKIMRQIREEKMELVAIYHSHPATEAYPSATDRELAFYPDASYVIISLTKKEAPIVRAFKISENQVVEEEIKVVG